LKAHRALEVSFPVIDNAPVKGRGADEGSLIARFIFNVNVQQGTATP